MIQKELDAFEQKVLTDLFGGYTSDKFVLNFGIFKYDFSKKVQSIITDFESLVKPFMTDAGYIDGTKLRAILNTKYLDIPDKLFRPSEIYYDIRPIILKLKGMLLP